MDSKLSWFMKNPAIYLGTILLLTFVKVYLYGLLFGIENLLFLSFV
ncbi:hypothetical protein KM925_30345 [Priestia megaterium]|nr:hypothetical protein [Priestia megaterium]MBU8590173.1 hypothetical protein [Priestia megaterium]